MSSEITTEHNPDYFIDSVRLQHLAFLGPSGQLVGHVRGHLLAWLGVGRKRRAYLRDAYSVQRFQTNQLDVLAGDFKAATTTDHTQATNWEAGSDPVSALVALRLGRESLKREPVLAGERGGEYY